MRLRQWSILLLALVLVSAAAFASAEDDKDEKEKDSEKDEGPERDDEKDDDRDEADEVERKVSVESDDEGVSFEFKRESGDTEDKLEASFSLDDATFEVKYENESLGTENELSLATSFESLVEYRDSDGDGRYSHDDEVVSAWGIGDPDDMDLDGRAQWGTPIVDDVTIDGQDGKRVRVPAVFAEESRFELRFYVFGDFVDLNGVDLRPTSVKIDILIAHYPYQANDTALAIILETETKQEVKVEDEDDEDEEIETSTTVGDTELSLVFTWLDHAEVDGSEQAVQTTILSVKEETERDSEEFESKVERRLAFSYPRGDEILHDPQTELRTRSVAVADSPAPGFIVGATALLGVAAWRRFR